MVERTTVKVGLHSIGDLLVLYCALVLASAKVLSPQAQQQSSKCSGSTPCLHRKPQCPLGVGVIIPMSPHNWEEIQRLCTLGTGTISMTLEYY